MTVFIGTSGWQYDDWRGVFYPSDVPKRDWLPYFSKRFRTTEINNTFYNLPEKSTFKAWADETPNDFVCSLKMSRYLTQMKKLKDPQEPMERFFARAEPLGKKLGPVLVLVPSNMQKNVERLDGVLREKPKGAKVAVEFRDDSWHDEEVKSVLESHDAALCAADEDSRPTTPLWRTADWGYIRMHAGRGKDAPCYGRGAIDSWAARISDTWGDRDVYLYFNNDTSGCAVRDARQMALALDRHGVRHSRVPDAGEVDAA